MTRRGDVFHLKSRIGFAPRGTSGAVVIVQAADVSAVWPTALAVPLDIALDMYRNDASVVPVPAAEAGAKADQMAIVTQLRPVRLDDLAPGAVGRLRPPTLARLDRVLRLLLGL